MNIYVLHPKGVLYCIILGMTNLMTDLSDPFLYPMALFGQGPESGDISIAAGRDPGIPELIFPGIPPGNPGKKIYRQGAGGKGVYEISSSFKFIDR
jgi:hypothetical protein